MAESVPACRKALDSLASIYLMRVVEGKEKLDHPGLALDRTISCLGDNSTAVRLAHQAAANSPASAAYRKAFDRWRSAHQRRGSRLLTLTLATPLAIGLGNESPSEIGITLQRTYGMPVVPGSAIKGLCRRVANQLNTEGKIGDDQVKALFGGTGAASHFVFWDAWYDPGTAEGRPIHRDVITVHHPGYYNNRGAGTWPTDFDDPIPNPFLVVRPGAGFLFALDAPSPEWADFALELLQWGLREWGAGAKTSSGYGRFGDLRRCVVNAGPAEAQRGTDGGTDAASAGEIKPIEQKGPQRTAEEWPGVMVRRDPGTRELTAPKGTRIARASGTHADELLKELPEWARASLLDKKKKKVAADITVEALGRDIRIVQIDPKGGAA